MNLLCYEFEEGFLHLIVSMIRLNSNEITVYEKAMNHF